jgi:large subunit ribosomal protein L29
MSGPEIRRRLVALAAWCGAAACVVTSLWVYVGISDRLRGNEAAPWMLARASGFTSYLLMMSLVLVGLLLAHPGATRLRGLNRAELNTKVTELKEELFSLRFQSATGQLESHGRLREVRKDIARIYTVIQERTLGIVDDPDAAEDTSAEKVEA